MGCFFPKENNDWGGSIRNPSLSLSKLLFLLNLSLSLSRQGQGNPLQGRRGGSQGVVLSSTPSFCLFVFSI